MSDERIQPNYINGVPRCSEEKCPSYDGKRCQLLGQKPDSICAPEVKLRFGQLERMNRCIEVLKVHAAEAQTLGLGAFHDAIQAVVLKLEIARHG